MKNRKLPPPSTKNLQLSRLGIITRGYSNNTITIDVNKLYNMEDCEILKCKGVGMFKLAQINQSREELIQFLLRIETNSIM